MRVPSRARAVRRRAGGWASSGYQPGDPARLVNRAEIDDGDKPGITTETVARIAELGTGES